MVRRTDKLLHLILRAYSSNRSSRTMGRLSEIRLPKGILKALIRSYCLIYRVSLLDADIPKEGFRRFNEFFTRRLKPNSREIDQRPQVIISPADGRIQSLGFISKGTLIQAKGKAYSLAELVGGVCDPSIFEGAPYITIYLSPKDYHRVHFPADGYVTACAHIPGRLYTVAPMATEIVPQLFIQNERIVISIETTYGPLIAVMVGAQGVGRISLSFMDVVTNVKPSKRVTIFEPKIMCKKGEEMGVFNLGSTVVMVLPTGDWRLLSFEGVRVRMGQGLFEYMDKT